MASGEEIRRYVVETAKKFDLNRFVKFNTSVKDAVWDGDAGKWNLKSESPLPS
jgi:cation diffusion facilitator CzcD-associated flavoprotein CzcO